VIVDAIFGTGLDREVTGRWREVIDALNHRNCPLLSLDTPSGLHADTGTVLGVAVHADVTISFIGLKQGLFTGMGVDYRGKIYFDDLQVPHSIYKQVKTSVTRLDYDELKTLLIRRPKSAHKGSFGHVLIIGGDSGMTGAARLAAEAAARVGAGKVSIATRATHAAFLNLARPEIMVHGIETAAELQQLITQIDIIAIGPGLGQSIWARAMLDTIKEQQKPIVLDADALNLLARAPFRLPQSVLTPHPGEAARLLEFTTPEIQNDRFTAVRALQLRFGGVCVLKGAGTLVAGANGQIGVCSAGNPGMACGGMGDVLTGVIAGLLAQGFSTTNAASLGVCLHAKAGDKEAENQGERGLLPSDLLPWIRHYANPEIEKP
jgi:NAD(P)H-hydrate epimerase